MVTFPDEKQTLTKILCRVFQRLEKTSNLKRMENILVSISCLQHSITVYKMSYWEKLAGNLSDLCIVSCNVRIFIYLGIKIKFQPVYKKTFSNRFFSWPSCELEHSELGKDSCKSELQLQKKFLCSLVNDTDTISILKIVYLIHPTHACIQWLLCTSDSSNKNSYFRFSKHL